MRHALVASIALLACSCGWFAGLDDVHAVINPDVGPDVDAALIPDAMDAPLPLCTGTMAMPADEGADHSEDETAIVWNANPPVWGTHYNSWAAWDRTYIRQIPRGYWVHNLEHGGVVLLFNCTDCQSELDRLTAIVQDSAIDPQCASPVKRKMLVTRDSFLPAGVRFAATAWGYSYTATCLNETELRDFAVTHYNHGTDFGCEDGSFRL